LQTDAAAETLAFAPHAPPDWTSFAIANVPVGTARLDLRYSKDTGGISLAVKVTGEGSRNIDFQPAVSLRAKVLGVEFNGRPVPFLVEANNIDQHVIVKVAAAGESNLLRIRTRDDFGVSYASSLPAIGASSQGLRILSENWTPARDRLTLTLSGLGGSPYRLAVWNGEQIASVEGAKLSKVANDKAELSLELPNKDGHAPTLATVVIQFSSGGKKRK